MVFTTIALTLISCQKKKEGSSTLSFSMPSSSYKASGKVGTLAVNFANVCYVANVTGGPIRPVGSSCEIPLGIHSSFVKPGATVELTVERGSGYAIQIFAYELANASDPCPTDLTPALYPKLFEVGKTNFDVNSPEVAISISVTDPGVNVIAQTLVPASCAVATTPGGGPVLVGPNQYRLYPSIGDADGRVLSTATHRLVLGKDGSQ